MAKTTKTDAVWQTIDADHMGAEITAKYQAYKTAYKAMKEARGAFEQAFSDGVKPADGKRVIFGYNFGKLSVAIVDGELAKPKAAASTQSLADWIASQRATGRGV